MSVERERVRKNDNKKRSRDLDAQVKNIYDYRQESTDELTCHSQLSTFLQVSLEELPLQGQTIK